MSYNLNVEFSFVATGVDFNGLTLDFVQGLQELHADHCLHAQLTGGGSGSSTALKYTY